MVSIDVRRIETLYALGANYEAIAAAAGCAPSSVRKVLAGRHNSQLGGRPDRDSGVRSRRVSPRRCRGCGGRIVELPCRLCLTLSWEAN